MKPHAILRRQEDSNIDDDATSNFSLSSSQNVSRMKPSSTLAAMQAAEALRATGVPVVDFGAGEPDFDTPENIKHAADEAMRAGKTKYTATAGIRELQQALIDFYAESLWRAI